MLKWTARVYASDTRRVATVLVLQAKAEQESEIRTDARSLMAGGVSYNKKLKKGNVH